MEAVVLALFLILLLPRRPTEKVVARRLLKGLGNNIDKRVRIDEGAPA
jgi:hypothetical protein